LIADRAAVDPLAPDGLLDPHPVNNNATATRDPDNQRVVLDRCRSAIGPDE
jgi:hypothetical protein